MAAVEALCDAYNKYDLCSCVGVWAFVGVVVGGRGYVQYLLYGRPLGFCVSVGMKLSYYQFWCLGDGLFLHFDTHA